MAAVCALDVGTMRIKAAVVGEDLAIGPVASVPSVLSAPGPGLVEVDADALWSQVLAVLREVAATGPRVAALVIANQRATTFLVDEAGERLAPGLSWQDSRGAEELFAWLAKVGTVGYTRITGLAPSAIWSLAKLLWWQEHGLPKGARLATVQDWLLRRLGASRWVLDPSNASLVGLLDVSSLEWHDGLVGEAGLGLSQLPALAPSGERVGSLAPGVAAATGLPVGTALVLGGGDQQCATLGAGVGRPGVAAANLGTAGVIDVTADRPAIDTRGRLVCLAHVVPGQWVLEGLANTYGGAHRWGRDLLGEELVSIAAGAPPGSRGLICLPYLAGSGAPDYDSAARGALLGLSLAHGRAEVARAILEGSTVELARILATAREMVGIERLVATGGGANSHLLLEMLANLTGVPVDVAPHPEAALLGAALLGWVGLGRWRDASTAATALAPPAETVMPDPALNADYRRLYDRYEVVLARLRQSDALTTGGED